MSQGTEVFITSSYPVDDEATSLARKKGKGKAVFNQAIGCSAKVQSEKPSNQIGNTLRFWHFQGQKNEHVAELDIVDGQN
jgi:hypothetical protein